MDYFAGLNISMDQTLAALEEIELFYERSDNSADGVRWSSPWGEIYSF